MVMVVGLTHDNAQELPQGLFLMEKERAQVYLPGRSLIFTKNPDDLTQGYAPQDIALRLVAPPELNESMRAIWDSRFENYGLAKKRAGKFLGMQRPTATQAQLDIPFFESGFLDWRCTLPVGDEYDAGLVRDCMRPPINIHHAVITADNQLLYVTRGTNRESWSRAILGFHSWGTDIDKDYACQEIMDDLQSGQGNALFSQAKQGIRRELNPFQECGPDTHNIVLEEIISPDDIEVTSASCLTLHIKPKDMGYHICFTAKARKEAGDIIERRKKHPPVGRILSYHSTPFTEDNMVEFFRKYREHIATSIEPAIVMACVQQFGEGFLNELPYAAHLQR
jgi:hypothetical protein